MRVRRSTRKRKLDPNSPPRTFGVLIPDTPEGRAFWQQLCEDSDYGELSTSALIINAYMTGDPMSDEEADEDEKEAFRNDLFSGGLM